MITLGLERKARASCNSLTSLKVNVEIRLSKISDFKPTIFKAPFILLSTSLSSSFLYLI